MRAGRAACSCYALLFLRSRKKQMQGKFQFCFFCLFPASCFAWYSWRGSGASSFPASQGKGKQSREQQQGAKWYSFS
uniref:hypothetical protein 5 n=1 Tax=Moniliophthora perniciosa TaxID=153609 RepID=UPI0000242332|nr:hypothetical protein 5 [Moniliophthora perniciosa]AAQ74295.1 hypothetical protein 5 [Moniliophthora perniciosa]